MTLVEEYHNAVKPFGQRAISASLALFGMLFLLLSSASAQFSGASSSSGGGGGHASSGGGSVSSFGHGGYVQTGSGVAFSGHSSSGHNSSGQRSLGSTWHSGNGFDRHNRRNANGDAFVYPYVYPYVYGVPYADLNDDNDNADDDDDSQYQGGPTIFDRRGSGRDSYIPPTYEGPAHAQTETATGTAPDTPTPAQQQQETPHAPTTLVFKDGQQLEVENYAIVDQTLYDLTPGHRRRIALADLDLPATERQNDDRGVDFQVPPSSQAN